MNNTITRGTTPTLSFTLPVNESEVSKLCIAFADVKGNIVLSKSEDDAVFSDGEVSVMLSQEDTLMFENDTNIYIQLKIKLTGGSVIASDIIETCAKRALCEEVL